jgi:MipA family protein
MKNLSQRKRRTQLAKLPLMLSVLLELVPASDLRAGEDGPSQFRDWQFSVGGGTAYGPAFLGSKDYQLSAVPDLTINYKDSFFFSQRDGLGYNVLSHLDSPSWQFGPIVRYAFERKENGDNPFRIAGRKSTALRGLGSVTGTIEVGGYVRYQWQDWSARAELRRGVNGHKGLVGDVSVEYGHDVHALFYNEGPPLIVSLGPHATLVDHRYNETYFGVTAIQSVRSGLPRFNAEGGLLTYGVGGSVVLPLTQHLTANLVTGFDRLADDAARSPLVSLRGSKNQFSGGVFISYKF